MKVGTNQPSPPQQPGGKKETAPQSGKKDFDAFIQQTGENQTPKVPAKGGRFTGLAQPKKDENLNRGKMISTNKTSRSEAHVETEGGKPASGAESKFESAMKRTGGQQDNAAERDSAGGNQDLSNQFGGQTFSVASYLEPSAVKGAAQANVSGANQIAEIERLVDNVLVGVNATGDPEFKLDVNLKQLGNLNVQVTRTEDGMVIRLNAEKEATGIQLGQNLQSLQAALSQKGLNVQNIELMVQNQAVPMAQLIEQTNMADRRVHRKEAASRLEKEKDSKSQATQRSGRAR